MWRSDFTATHYRSRAGCLERPRFDRNLTATGCLPLSVPVRLGEPNPYRSAVMSPCLWVSIPVLLQDGLKNPAPSQTVSA
jgi:hypothetical protein